MSHPYLNFSSVYIGLTDGLYWRQTVENYVYGFPKQWNVNIGGKTEVTIILKCAYLFYTSHTGEIKKQLISAINNQNITTTNLSIPLFRPNIDGCSLSNIELCYLSTLVQQV